MEEIIYKSCKTGFYYPEDKTLGGASIVKRLNPDMKKYKEVKRRSTEYFKVFTLRKQYTKTP